MRREVGIARGGGRLVVGPMPLDQAAKGEAGEEEGADRSDEAIDPGRRLTAPCIASCAVMNRPVVR